MVGRGRHRWFACTSRRPSGSDFAPGQIHPPRRRYDGTARSARFAPPSLPLRSSFAFTPVRSGALARLRARGCRLVQARQGGGTELGSEWEMKDITRMYLLKKQGTMSSSMPSLVVQSAVWRLRVLKPGLSDRAHHSPRRKRSRPIGSDEKPGNFLDIGINPCGQILLL